MQYKYADIYEIYYYFIKWDNYSLLEPVRGLADKLRYTLRKYDLGIEVEIAGEAENRGKPDRIYITYPTKQDIKITYQENYYSPPATLIETSLGMKETTVERKLETTDLYPQNLKLTFLDGTLRYGFKRSYYSSFTYVEPRINITIETEKGEITAALTNEIGIEYIIKEKTKTLYREETTKTCEYSVTIYTSPQTTTKLSDLATGKLTIHIITDRSLCRKYLLRNRFKIATEMAHALDTLLETNKLLIKELEKQPTNYSLCKTK